ETLYFCGAKVEDVYPLSLLLPGQTLNITLLSYAGHLNFGFVCCRRSLPGFDVIGQYLKESLAALEQATLSEVAKVVRQKAVEFPVE
ncbi:MAG: WS/DGAT domain-containing protein, partial [Plesiomonas shigelloides]